MTASLCNYLLIPEVFISAPLFTGSAFICTPLFTGSAFIYTRLFTGSAFIYTRLFISCVSLSNESFTGNISLFNDFSTASASNSAICIPLLCCYFTLYIRQFFGFIVLDLLPETIAS